MNNAKKAYNPSTQAAYKPHQYVKKQDQTRKQIHKKKSALPQLSFANDS